jgi:hypothetical protein
MGGIAKERMGGGTFSRDGNHHLPFCGKIHMKQKGDVLVDDYLKYRQKWIDAKGIFVHYTDADTALAELAELFDLRVPPPAAQMLFSQASQA